MLEFESLESRTLMSATISLEAGVLTVTGTDAVDKIQVSVPLGSSDLRVMIDGIANFVPLEGITQIKLIGGGSADLLTLDSSVKIQGIFDGGAGKDVMSGGAADDIFYASGDGAGDLIAGGGGRDTAYVDPNDSANVEIKIFPGGGGPTDPGGGDSGGGTTNPGKGKKNR